MSEARRGERAAAATARLGGGGGGRVLVVCCLSRAAPRETAVPGPELAEDMRRAVAHTRVQ